jgi:hypothetical protein
MIIHKPHAGKRFHELPSENQKYAARLNSPS